MDYTEVSEEEIKNKYFKPPTVEQIMGFVYELNVTTRQFERFYSIPKDVIRHVKANRRDLPVKYWPVFYEKIVPKYGISFRELNKLIFRMNGSTNKRTIRVAKVSNHDRTATLV